jgi:hypothetical protein
MAINEILPFASTNTGTNLLTQAEYTSDAQRIIGHQPGIARSKLENKVLRQASLMASGLAEFIADYQANNVTDALTPQQVADYLLAAILANSPVTPDASETVKGKIEIATAAEAQSYASSLLALTPATMNQALKGANQLFNANGGYQRLPGGMIIQWGYQATQGGVAFATFPIAFPNQCVLVLGNSYSYPNARFVVTDAPSTTQVRVATFGLGGTTVPDDVRYIAFGY